MASGDAEFKDRFGRPIRDLRVSVTDRCNFRCPYCMPAEVYGEKYEFLPKRELLSFEETARLTRIFVRLGVTKVRLTGGEPLVRNGLEELIALLASIDGIEDLTLTTNGYLLAQKAAALSEAGLRRITVSLDSLDEGVFKEMNGRGYGPKRVLEGIRVAGEVGLKPIKINAVVQRGVNDHTIVDLARHFKGTGHILRFIEYMDVGNLNGWRLGPRGLGRADRRSDRRRDVPGAGRTQLQGRGGPALPVLGRRWRDRNHRVGDQALLRRLHQGAVVHRRHAVHLPVRQRGHRPEGLAEVGRQRR